jgi:hypothetical protein
MKSTPHPEFNSQQVIAGERNYLKIEPGQETRAIAVSGGGIRSASFGMGVMQALVANRQLSKMDYMSTVSGGGYLGSALTYALSLDPEPGEPKPGTDPENFPLGRRKASGSREGKDNRLLDFIRQHSSYLIPVSSLGPISFAAVVFRSIFVALVGYILIFSAILAIADQLYIFSVHDFGGFKVENLNITIETKSHFLIAAVALMALSLVLNLSYSLLTFFTRMETPLSYLRFVRGQQAAGVLWTLVIVFFFIGMMPHVYGWVHKVAGGGISSAGSTTLIGVFTGIWRYRKAQKKEASDGVMSDILIYFGAFCLLFGILLFAYMIGVEVVDKDITWLLVLCGAALVFGVFVNLNMVGPHRLWRDRLMEAFMPNRAAVKDNKWEPATEADTAMMKDMCGPKNPRPYHLVNTNIVLVNSPSVKFRGRGGDNFIISPLFSGSDATSWAMTEDFQKTGKRGITLASAMATSAAALNPQAGVSGEGLTRNAMISMLLSLLNLRLGYWTTNPDRRPSAFPPNFFSPGLIKEVAGSGFNETSRNILLSDGGHFENLAIYELIRRKVSLIVLSDGGADLQFNFDDLANAVEKARVDFGAKISFKDDDINHILGGTAGESPFVKKYNIAKQGYAIGDIYYNDGTKGKLVYIKLAMIPELPTDIYSYKGVNPDFPHQSTADQFFNEKQFEAYRELGYNVTWKMMMSEEGKKLFGEPVKE